MRRMVASYLARRGLHDAFAGAVLICGMWTVMTWLQVGLDWLRLRAG